MYEVLHGSNPGRDDQDNSYCWWVKSTAHGCWSQTTGLSSGLVIQLCQLSCFLASPRSSVSRANSFSSPLETSRLVMEAESFRPTSQGLSGVSLSLGLLLDQRVLCVGGDFALQSVLFWKIFPKQSFHDVIARVTKRWRLQLAWLDTGHVTFVCQSFWWILSIWKQWWEVVLGFECAFEHPW